MWLISGGIEIDTVFFFIKPQNQQRHLLSILLEKYFF